MPGLLNRPVAGLLVVVLDLQVIAFPERAVFPLSDHPGLSLEASSSHLDALSRKLLSIRDEDLVRPHHGVRGLAARNVTERGLQGGMCVRSLLDLIEPLKMKEWRDCYIKKIAKVDLRVAGSVMAANLECWCETKVQDALQEYGCCASPDFALLCMAECKPDCAKPAAAKCVKECPGVCLENDYAPEFCASSCGSCGAHILCIAEQSKKLTEAGNPENPLLCHDIAFDDSPEWKKWMECYEKQPKRTHWQRHNAENYCYCQANLKAAAQKNNCCKASWGKTICDEQCADAIDAPYDCFSAEATSCSNMCKGLCSGLYQERVNPDCKAKCYDKGAACARYSACKPSGHIEFDYVCDDSKKPMNNGCCPVDAQSVACPKMCDSGAPHYPVHIAAGLKHQHGLECQCVGCPSSTKAAEQKMTDALKNDLWNHGVAALATISKQVGILGANRKMQELMKERNDKITTMYEARTPGDSQKVFQGKVDLVVSEYRGLIILEAERFKAAGEKETNPQVGNPSKAPLAGGTKPAKEEVQFSYTLKDMVYSQLNDETTAGLITAIKEGVLEGLPAGHTKDHIKVKLRSGSIKAEVSVTPKAATTAAQVSSALTAAKIQKMRTSVMAKVTAVPNIETVLAAGRKMGDVKLTSTAPSVQKVTGTTKSGPETTVTGKGNLVGDGEKQKKKGKKDGDGGGVGTTAIVAIASVSAVFVLLGGMGVMYKCGKAHGRSNGDTQNTANMGGMVPVEGDSNVVMGRPVEGTAGEAAQGAVVTTKGADDSNARHAEDPDNGKQV